MLCPGPCGCGVYVRAYSALRNMRHVHVCGRGGVHVQTVSGTPERRAGSAPCDGERRRVVKAQGQNRDKSRVGDGRTRWSNSCSQCVLHAVPVASQPRSATTTIRSRIPPAYCYQGNGDARPSHCVWENASPASCRPRVGDYMYPPIPYGLPSSAGAPGAPGGGSSRISVIKADVVSTDAAMEHELSTACCVTVAGSRTPVSRRFS